MNAGQQPDAVKPAVAALVKARALIADPAKWGQGPRSERPTPESFCAAEAIEECAVIVARKEAFALLRTAAGIPQELFAVTDWNDAPERTHSEVLAAFDRAIEAAA